MMSLLEFKTRIQNLYQKYSIYIEPIIKFVVSMVIFIIINSNIGYDDRLKSAPIVLALSLLCAFTPSAVLVLLSILISALHIFHVSPILALIILVIFMIMYLLYFHFIPELGYVLVATPILYALNLHYIIPIMLGLFASPIAIIASACGLIIIYLFQIVVQVVNMQFGNTIEDALEIYTYVIDNLLKNKEMILTIAIFSFITIITYAVRRFKFDYSKEIAVAAGALTCLLGFLTVDLQLGVTEQIAPMFLGTLISAILALVIQFFYRALDYSRSEYLQFEDDDYFYYVKAVPKIVVSEQNINIKRINPQRTRDKREDREEVYDDLEDEYYYDESGDEFYFEDDE